MKNFSRNNKTNALLGTIYDYLVVQGEPPLDISITVCVNGLLITGELISPEDFFKLENNSPFEPIYTNFIKKEELKYFKENGDFIDSINEDEIPDYVWQRFIYLKNARYISGGVFIPGIDNAGVSIQIRASDISSLNFTSFTASKSQVK